MGKEKVEPKDYGKMLISCRIIDYVKEKYDEWICWKSGESGKSHVNKTYIRYWKLWRNL